MPNSHFPVPTPAESEILECLWAAETDGATAPEIKASVENIRGKEISIHAVHKLLSVMERKSLVSRARTTNELIRFFPRPKRRDIEVSALQQVKDATFDGNFRRMALPFVKSATSDELQELRKLLEEHENEKRLD